MAPERLERSEPKALRRGASAGRYGGAVPNVSAILLHVYMYLTTSPATPRADRRPHDCTAARLEPRSEPKRRDSVHVKFLHVVENADAADTEAVCGMVLSFCATTDGSEVCPCVASALRVTPSRRAREPFD